MTTFCFPELFFPFESCKESILHSLISNKGLVKFILRFSFYMHNMNMYLLSRFLGFTNQFLHSFLINTLNKQAREQSNRERERADLVAEKEREIKVTLSNSASNQIKTWPLFSSNIATQSKTQNWKSSQNLQRLKPFNLLNRSNKLEPRLKQSKWCHLVPSKPHASLLIKPGLWALASIGFEHFLHKDLPDLAYSLVAGESLKRIGNRRRKNKNRMKEKKNKRSPRRGEEKKY